MDMDRLLKREEVASLMRVSLRSVMRYQQRGLKHIKVGRSIRYKLNDVLAFMEKHKKGDLK